MCDMDCKNCKLPVEKCRGGDFTSAWRNQTNVRIKPSQPVKFGKTGFKTFLKR